MQSSTDAANALDSETIDTLVAGKQSVSIWQRIVAFYLERRQIILGVVSVTLFLSTWQIAVERRFLDEFIFSKPSAIASVGYLLLTNGTIFDAIRYTAMSFAVGFTLAILLGVPMGILIGWYPTLRGLMQPYVSALNATPRIALYPLFVVWFGIGLETKIVIVFISSLLPILFNTIGGVNSLDPSFIDVARCMGANDRQVFKTVVLPASVPFIMTGLRIGVGHALLAAIISELFIGSTGLGALLGTYAAYFKTANLMAVILVVATSGVLLLSAIHWVEQKVELWRPRV